MALCVPSHFIAKKEEKKFFDCGEFSFSPFQLDLFYRAEEERSVSLVCCRCCAEWQDCKFNIAKDFCFVQKTIGNTVCGNERNTL